MADAAARRKASLKKFQEKCLARTDEEVYRDRVRLRPDGRKECAKCRKKKRFSQFGRNLRTSDGPHGRCRRCTREDAENWRHRKSARTSEEKKADLLRLRPSGEKICCNCEETKPMEEYATGMTFADGHQPVCRTCRAIQSADMNAERKKLRDEVRKRGCIVCGLKDIRCMELAHRDRSEKLRRSNGRTVGPCGITSMQDLIEELKLVDPKCAMCHAKQTHSEQKAWTRHLPNREQANAEKRKRGSCIDCKIPVDEQFWLFDFDHVRGEKIDGISQMARKTAKYTSKQIELEMAKCDLRCKNCHKIVTADRLQASGQLPDESSDQLSDQSDDE